MKNGPKSTPESLTTKESSQMLKSVDVTNIGPDEKNIRKESRKEDSQEMIDSLTSTAGIKGALFGYRKSDVIDLMSLARDKMYEMSDVIDSQSGTIENLKELQDLNVETVIDNDTVSETEDSQLDQYKIELSKSQELAEQLQVENTNLKSQLEDIESERLKLIEDGSTLKESSEELSATKSELENAYSTIEKYKTNVAAMESTIEQLRAESLDKDSQLRAKDAELIAKDNELEVMKQASTSSDDAYKEIGRVLADANRTSDEIISNAHTKADEILTDAETRRQHKLNQTNEDIQKLVDTATSQVEEMFDAAAKARTQMISSHNTMMNAVKANQKQLIDFVIEQKDMLQTQVGLVTSSEFEDLVEKSPLRLNGADSLLNKREADILSGIKNLSNRTIH